MALFELFQFFIIIIWQNLGAPPQKIGKIWVAPPLTNGDIWASFEKHNPPPPVMFSTWSFSACGVFTFSDEIAICKQQFQADLANRM